jgi:hypothetical protein
MNDAILARRLDEAAKYAPDLGRGDHDLDVTIAVIPGAIKVEARLKRGTAAIVQSKRISWLDGRQAIVSPYILAIDELVKEIRAKS